MSQGRMFFGPRALGIIPLNSLDLFSLRTTLVVIMTLYLVVIIPKKYKRQCCNRVVFLC